MKKLQNEITPQKYLISQDVGYIMEDWLKREFTKKGLKTEETKPVISFDFYNELTDKLIASMRKHCFRDKTVSVEKVSSEFFKDLFLPVSKQESEFWISLDRVYVKNADYYLDVTRLVDRDRQPVDSDIKIGNRPENRKSFFQQVEECVEKMPNIKIVLLDDGTFKGDTVTDVLDALEDRGIIVDEVRLGICKGEGEQKIIRWQWPKDVDPPEAYRIGWIKTAGTCPPLLDWVCERDFFPGVPLCGRAVGKKTAKTQPPQPILTSPGEKPVRIPYLFPEGREEWVNLTHGFRDFSREAFDLTIELWKKVEETLGRSILVKDIPTIPSWLYHKDFPVMEKRMEKPWLDVIHQYQEFV